MVWNLTIRVTSLVVLLVLFGANTPCALSQEPEDDEPESVSEQIREAERSQERLRGELKLVEQRLKLLRELRKLETQLEPVEDELEKTNDDERREELEVELERIEISIEETLLRLDFNERRRELTGISYDLAGEGSRAVQQEASALLRMLDNGVKLADRVFRVIRNGEDDVIEELEVEYEEFEEAFERRREILELKVELHFAIDEDDEEVIRELQQELKQLLQEHAEDEPDERAEMDRPLPAPIRLTEADIAAASKLNFDEQIVPLLRNACFECHNSDSTSGDLDLASLVKEQPLVVNHAHWRNVIQQLKVRSMPPAEERQPKEADRRRLAAWLTDAIENFDYRTIQQPGYEPARRLTHDEYNHTVRDLTGIDLRPADRFPTDMTASSGFENSANSLFIQPVLLERYVGAAEVTVDSAWPGRPETEAQKRAWRDLIGADVPSLETTLAQSKIVKDVLQRFVTRAFRRPASAEELSAFMKHFELRRSSGVSATDALRDVLQVVLVSPSFLIRSERDAGSPGETFRVSDWELASRLSYFLWASMPDDELFQLAESGQLNERGVLASQVDRMLADDRAGSLGRLFAAQWLGFADIDRVQRDQIDNPWATDSLVEAMREESALLFNSLVKKNQPIDRLVDAEYTFLNEELARHYQMDSVSGANMRQVSLADSPRRGILGHGSILAVTSFPGRTSPVLRGNWILSRLLGTPPPPPPPNAGDFDDRVADNDRLSQRQKLEMHRRNPNCYACHSQIDPLGFALEEFEWFGRYRPVRRGKRIDAKGTLPGGREFSGLTGLSRALLAERSGDLANQFTRKMLSYALGRQLEYYDEATVADLLRQLEANDRQVRSLIVAIVQSDAFQMKQLPGEQLRN